MVCVRPALTYCATDVASIVAASTFIPAPGATTLTTIRPMTSASVVTTSKYTSAKAPALPTAFVPAAPAMPTTTVQKMTGAMIILTSLMNPSPSGFIAMPASGQKCPSTTPMTVAIST